MDDAFAPLLILGAGYIGARLAELALAAGHRVTLADNWYATRAEQLRSLEDRGARVETADIRNRDALDALLETGPARVYLLAAQASRPLSWQDPDYTEATNVTGARRVAEAVAEAGMPLVYASSLHVYGADLDGDVDERHPYGEQGDLAHLSKIYAELCLSLHARRASFDLALLRLGIVYGPSSVTHARAESQTVVEKFRQLAWAGEPLPLDDSGRATIGVVHVDDVARIMLGAPHAAGVSAANVSAQTLTVADLAALAEGRHPAAPPPCRFVGPFEYRHRVEDYLRP